MDLVMPEMDGIGATAAIKQSMPQIEVMVMTSFIEDEKVFGAMRAGATGYVLKDRRPRGSCQRHPQRRRGRVAFDPRVVRRLMQEFNPAKTKAETATEPLSEREIEVLKLVAKGYSNQQIAEQLIISPKTARNSRQQHPEQTWPRQPDASGCIRYQGRPREWGRGKSYLSPRIGV